MINVYDIGIEIFYTNEDTTYIEFSKEIDKWKNFYSMMK
jgi:hypothetical protein